MYPISYEADPALEGRNRLTTFFRYIVAIPWQIVAYVYGIVAEIAAIIAWFAIVFTGKYPEGLYNFNAGYLRMSSRANSFLYLLTDEFPPFGGEEAADYPVRIGVPADVGALIFTVRRIIRPNLHRSKLVEKKNAAVHADALLFVKNRAARIELDQQRDQQPQRCEYRQRNGSNNQIRRAFDDARPARKRGALSV